MIMKQIVKPNFFILGAAKCGTTFLYNTLTHHPDIFFPTEKEPYPTTENFPVNSKENHNSVLSIH